MQDLVPIALTAGLIIQIFIALSARSRFVAKLRASDPNQWFAFGKPGPGLPESIPNSLTILKYLLRGDFNSSNDKELIRVASRFKTCLLVYFCYFAFTIIVMIWWSSHHR